MNIIIFDFEVFKFDTLLGALIVNEDNIQLCQTWDIDKIKRFYDQNKNAIWVGHNNIGYDNPILEAVINDNDPYIVSQFIINTEFKMKSSIPRITYDTMKSRGFYSLKITELAVGKNISTSEIDFGIDRPLTAEEKIKTEKYNQDDLFQTYDNFKALYYDFELRINLMQEFNLDWRALTMTETQIAAYVLKAKKIKGIENQIIKPKIYDTLQVKNQQVIDFYLNEDFKKGIKLEQTFCGCKHYLAAGGIHGALKKVYVDKALYFDVSGYYNLIMLNYDLLPRTMNEESKEIYKGMYFNQLKLKKIPEKKKKRAMYKVVLLAVFGSMMNEYTDFYDPNKGQLVTVTGELFLVDLLEKLEGKVNVIQSNTDGIIAEPKDWNNVDEIIGIIREWEARTGFTIEIDEISNIWQRDVNNYCYIKNGKVNVKGEALSAYNQLDNPIVEQIWSLKEAQIISKGIVDYLIYGITPEKTVEMHKNNLLAFQFIAKKNSFDYLSFEDKNGEHRLNYGINRVFPLNKLFGTGAIYKNKVRNGKHTKSKIAGLPANVFIYNDDIRSQSTILELNEIIDFEYYVNRIWERLGEFVPDE